MERDARRLGAIFNALNKNPRITVEEMDLILDKKFGTDEKVIEKGDETERMARKKISRFYFTNKAYIVSEKENFDQCGCDIKVEFEPEKLHRWLGRWVSIPNGYFYLQVKSSDVYLEKYLKEKNGKSGQALLRKKIIVVNGRLEDEDFEKCIKEGLSILNEYWRERRSHK